MGHLNILFTVLGAWLLADFLAGTIHWAEDRLLGKTRFGFLEMVRLDNELHHKVPVAMLRFSLWQNINTSAIIAWPLGGALILVGAPMILWLAVFMASVGNVVHRYAHTPRAKIPGPIRALQRSGIWISPTHHNAHHFDANGLIAKEDTVGKYCPMTSWLNPVLDKLQFWRMAECVVDVSIKIGRSI